MSSIENNGFHGEWSITDKSNREIGIISFDSKTIRSAGGSEEWRLTKYQYNLFRTLLDNRGRLLSPEELYDAYKGEPGAHSQDAYVDYKKNLTDAVYNMKKKFPFLKECIENGKGYGAYYFNGNLYKIQDDDQPSADRAPTASATVVITEETRRYTEVAEINRYLPGESVPVEAPKRKKLSTVGKVIIIAVAVISLLLLGFLAAHLIGNNSGKGAEDTAARIMDEHDDIVRSILSGACDSLAVDDGLTAYTEDGSLVSVVAEKSYGSVNYRRSFFYSGGKLMFAEYAGEDLHQFFFENGELIRWRYSESTSGGKKAVDRDRENSSVYSQWEQRVLGDSAGLIDEWEFAEMTLGSIMDSIIPDGNSRYMSDADLITLSSEEQYRINIFLSNFAEQDFTKFDRNSPNEEELLRFAYINYMINYPYRIELTPDSREGILTYDLINKSITRYFGVSVKKKNGIVNYPNGIRYSDGSYYFSFGMAEPHNGIAVVDSIEEQFDGTVKASFKIYSVDKYNTAGDVISDKNYYYLTPAEAASSSGLSYVRSGTAVLDRYRSGGIDSFRLIKYDLF